MHDQLVILVVEDDRVYAEFLVETLRKAGHEVAAAETGADARARAAALRPDAVILDLVLPDESGYAVAGALRRGALPDTSVIILLTANMFPERDIAAAMGIDVVLSKPVQAELVTGIVDLVHARRAKRAR